MPRKKKVIAGNDLTEKDILEVSEVPKTKKSKKSETVSDEIISEANNITENNIHNVEVVVTTPYSEVHLGENTSTIARELFKNPHPQEPLETPMKRFKEKSQFPFELRFKGVKIYDSKIDKSSVSFEENWVIVAGKKYNYLLLRIINK